MMKENADHFEIDELKKQLEAANKKIVDLQEWIIFFERVIYDAKEALEY